MRWQEQDQELKTCGESIPGMFIIWHFNRKLLKPFLFLNTDHKDLVKLKHSPPHELHLSGHSRLEFPVFIRILGFMRSGKRLIRSKTVLTSLPMDQSSALSNISAAVLIMLSARPIMDALTF
jgi:hypothetical protein